MLHRIDRLCFLKVTHQLLDYIYYNKYINILTLKLPNFLRYIFPTTNSNNTKLDSHINLITAHLRIMRSARLNK